VTWEGVSHPYNTGRNTMLGTLIDRNTRVLIVAGFLGIAGTVTSVASGAEPDKLGAQALFDEAKHLMDTGKTDQACPKFEASLQLDSTVPTLLSLAQCYEKLGRLASAYLTYRAAESDATAAEQTKRAKTAHDKAEKLLPKLSRITIRVSAEANVKGLQVTRNGMNVAPPTWGTPIPVDPGPHNITAQANGKKWSERVEVGGNAAQVFVDVPNFAPAAPPAVVPVARPAAAKPAAAAPAPAVVPIAPKPAAPAVAPKPAPPPVAAVPPKPAAPPVAAQPKPAVPPPPTAAPPAPAAVAPPPPKPTVAPAPPAAPVAAKPAAPAVAPVAVPPPKPVAQPAPAPKALATTPPASPPAAAPTPATPSAAGTVPASPSEPKDTSGSSWLTQQNIGIGVAALGVVGLGFGTYFALRSHSKESTAAANCPNDICINQEGIDANDAAISAKKMSTWSFVAGGALVAGGVVLILTAPQSSSVAQLRLHPFVGANAASLTLTGGF
jgi:hypothetical protein